MILCTCKSISSKQVERLAAERQLDPQAALAQLGGGSVCGQCKCPGGGACGNQQCSKLDRAS